MAPAHAVRSAYVMALSLDHHTMRSSKSRGPHIQSARLPVQAFVATRLNDWLLLDADLAVSRARFTQFDPAGDYIPGSIDKVASLGFSVTDYKGWFGGMQLRYFGPCPLIEDNCVRSQSTVLTNARIGYTIANNTCVTLDVFNLFNRKASDIDYLYSSQ